MITENEKLFVNVFGKEGCAKCSMLNRRIDALLQEEQYSAFSKVYCDVLSEEGLMKFCKAECLNPSRIPAMVISKIGPDGQVAYLDNPAPGAEDEICRKSRLHQFLGIQTDYSEEGKGIITPEMIKSILDEALKIA